MRPAAEVVDWGITAGEAVMGLKACDARMLGGLVAGALALAPFAAHASEMIIGGRAELCAVAAKAGNHTAEAIENCTTAIGVEPINGHMLAATYVNRGTMYLGASNFANAIKDFDEALKVEPGLGVAYVNRGGALIGMRKFKDAEVEITKGLALMPEEPEKAYGNRALARWSQDNLQGAYEDFTQAQALKPDWEWPKEQLTHFTLAPKK
jgi:tetratricopeptide (TPR) repeat protein